MACRVSPLHRLNVAQDAKVCRIPSTTLLLIVALTLFMRGYAFGHDVSEHLDPELLTGWRTWLHLIIQWTHLVAFALWLGLTAGVLLLGMEPNLHHLLNGSWILFLVFLATGAYNMEWSAGISEIPSLFRLPLLNRIPYGVTYTVVLAVKLVLDDRFAAPRGSRSRALKKQQDHNLNFPTIHSQN